MEEAHQTRAEARGARAAQASPFGRGTRCHPSLIGADGTMSITNPPPEDRQHPLPTRRQGRAAARAAEHAAASSRDRHEMANMMAALLVARELLRCRLLDSGHDALLLRVAELLDAASTRAEPFCFHTTTRGTGCRASRARLPVWSRPAATYEGDMGYDPLNPAYDAAPLPRSPLYSGTAPVEEPSGGDPRTMPNAGCNQAPASGGSGAEGREADPTLLALDPPPSPPTTMEHE